MKIFLIAIMILLSIVGLSELLHRIWIAFLRPKNIKNYLLLILQNEDAYEQSCAALSQIKWHGSEFADKIIALNTGLNDKQISLCRALSIENKNYIFCNIEELENVI